MEIQNKFCEGSLDYRQKGHIDSRMEELAALYDVSEFCKDNNEKMEYSSQALYGQEIKKGVLLADWLFEWDSGSETMEMKQFFWRMVEQMWRESLDREDAEVISCSLGEQEGFAHDLKSYIKARRKILEGMTEPREYARMMPSCFGNSVFAEGIEEEMQNIEDFALHTKELTLNLSVLNDEALEIYGRCHKDGNLAMKELDSRLLACSPDYKHQSQLRFEFSYIDEEGDTHIKKVTCHPHLKLVKKNSDYRIYFAWRDDLVGDGKKVLVGRIGRHGW
ncbi:hypothetical protein IMSAGC019_00028 [Lachnospiraceae bacterium]|nr:hypothetical protein IMSAGC019_00028 [Lachnospiraceae bacterium]